MANVLYPSVKTQFLNGGVIMLSHDIRVMLIDLADYTFDSAHDTLSDVALAARVATSGALAGKTAVAGVFDAINTSMPGVTGDESEALIMFRYTAAESAPLIMFIDDFVTGAPLTPNGGSVDIIWNAAGIFAL